MSEELVQLEEKLIRLPGQWLVIGSGSLIGSRFLDLAGPTSSLYGAGLKELDFNNKLLKGFSNMDVTSFDQVLSALDQTPGKYVINFSGATLVDQIEKNRPKDPNDPQQLNQDLAYRLNVLGTRNIAEACKKLGKLPIFISTESVFDGNDGPYSEDDQIVTSSDGISWYGWTKALAENEATNSGTPFLMIRISYPYRREYPGKGDFARNFLRLYDATMDDPSKKWYPIFTDQLMTPTFVDDLPRAVLTLIDSGASGIYHLVSPEECTPYDFCIELLRVARGVENADKIIPTGSVIEFQQQHKELAKRPLDGRLKSDKITRLGFKPTNWKDGILIYAS